MLRRTLPLSKPCIIGNENQQIRPNISVAYKLWKNALVTNQRLNVTNTRNVQGGRTVTKRKHIALHSKECSQPCKRYIFPKRHQTAFVIFRFQVTLWRNDAKSIKILVIRRITLVSNDDVGALGSCCNLTLCHWDRQVDRCFRPNDKIYARLRIHQFNVALIYTFHPIWIPFVSLCHVGVNEAYNCDTLWWLQRLNVWS